jgi:hypothetical protein
MKRPGKSIVLVGLVLGLAAAVACSSDDEENGTGSSSSGGSGGGSAKKFFVDKVHTSMSDTCRECHGTASRGAPVFLGPNAEASYTAIEGFPGLVAAPSFSPIVQKGVHSGPALTQTQNDLVTQWLNLEVKARKLGSDPGAPKNLRAAFKAFGACMDYAKWKALKLHTIAATDTEGNRGQCRSCHSTGEASLWLSGGGENDEQQNAITFSKFQQFPYIQRLVVGRVKDDGTFESIEAARRLIDKGTEAQQLQANSHPRFSLSSELVAGLTSYVLETISNLNANRCTGVTQPDAGLLDAAQ